MNNQSPLELLCSFAVESGGGKFSHVERTIRDEKPLTLVVFIAPRSKTKFKLPVLELTHDRVTKLVKAADEVLVAV